MREAETDYRTSLGGKLPAYKVNVPASLTKDKFYEIQNQITKSKAFGILRNLYSASKPFQETQAI
jgi:hypothetical protein